MTTTPSQAAQRAEADSRLKDMDPNALTDQQRAVPEMTADTTTPDPLSDPLTTRTPIPVEETDRRQGPTPRKDTGRDAIVARFRQQRQEEAESGEETDADEIRRFAKNGMPPELIPLHEPAPAEVAETEPEVVAAEPDPTPEAPPPAKRKLKVRGKEIELSEEELVAAAQKALAADDYLDEAKQKLKDVDTLLRDTRSRATRTAQPAEHHEPADGAQPTDADAQPAPGSEHPADKFSSLVEKLQYGDPKEAAVEFRQTLSDMAGEMSKDALRQERTRNDTIRSRKVLQDFMGAHPELANDEFASAAIEKRLFNLQREDIVGLGVDEAQIPQTPAAIAQWHQWYRVEGMNVRDAGTLLTTARDDFLKWRNPTPAPAVPTPAPKPAPSVVITTDRQARRTTVQQQPTRTVAPKPDSVVNPPPVKDRSDIVQQMRVMRGRPRGQVAV